MYKLIKLIKEGVDPNTIVDGETIFLQLIDMPALRLNNPIVQLMLDRGANPNSRIMSTGRYPLDICRCKDEMILMRYGATKYDSNEKTRHVIVLKRVLIVCDMMLYADGIPSDWIIRIKECIY